MVKADAEPVAPRVRWTSTRRAAEEDEDRESILLGGVPLVPTDDNAPLALEDPWWLKLTGFRSPQKAVFFAAFIIGVGLYFIIAGTVQERLTRAIQLCHRLDELDTSRNSVQSWLDWIKVAHFHRPRAKVQHVDRSLALECAAQGWNHECTQKVFDAQRNSRRQQQQQEGGGLGPQVSETVTYIGGGDRGRGNGRELYGDELRLPVGAALAYHAGVVAMEKEECASGDIFHYVCYTQTARSGRKVEGLKRSLLRVIQHLAPGSRTTLAGKRLELLRSLLAQAAQMGVTTEISRPDLHSDTARVLRTQLVRLREREQDGQQYSDIMLYPGSQHLLYRGDFLGAKFDGEGSLYYRQGNQVAYQGEWKDGKMEGWGLLLGQDGDTIWDGYFEAGRPTRPW